MLYISKNRNKKYLDSIAAGVIFPIVKLPGILLWYGALPIALGLFASFVIVPALLALGIFAGLVGHAHSTPARADEWL